MAYQNQTFNFGKAGTIVIFGGILSNIPDNFLACNGYAYKSSDYPDLYSKIGTQFGNGTYNPNGETLPDFNVPDLRGLIPRGYDNGRNAIDSRGDPDASSRTSLNSGNTGDNIGSYQNDQIKEHSHTFATQTINGDTSGSGETTDNMINPALSYQGTSIFTTTGDSTNENRGKNVYVEYIIRTKDIVS